MSAEARQPESDLPPDLEEEPVSLQGVAAEVESHRGLARCLDRLLAAITLSNDLEAFLRELLQLLLEVSGADAAVLRLREGDQLRSRAAIGLVCRCASSWITVLIPLAHLPVFARI